jgi:hypothetical protein
LSEDMVAEALVLRTECMHEEKCSLNFGGYAIRVKEELFSMDLPDLCPECLSTSTFISCKGHISPLEANIRA